jgi:hypothetical protein
MAGVKLDSTFGFRGSSKDEKSPMGLRFTLFLGSTLLLVREEIPATELEILFDKELKGSNSSN